MPDLSFSMGEPTALRYAAVPTILAPVKIVNAHPQRPVRSIVLNCQVQLEPAARPYTAQEEAKLLDLFGERDRWARTMKPMLWTNAVLKVPGFAAETTVDLLLPCSMDFDVAATKFFYGLDAGYISVTVLFSGTVFYNSDEDAMQVMQIPWDREARFRLPVEVWKAAVAMHYPELVWMRLPKETFDRLYRYKVARGIPSLERMLERLLDQAELAEVRDPLAPAAGVQR
jgi:hypothetical protein